eukprot:TRINITY_DN1036_c0_g1_i2.p1 TRINITY_DN1036_c0_g1~~TRINITY_DN1036_c0_g1_i2.p1  ORF type:complete len:170 (-),score=92.09 TRINITY_DN1036_c0_g1_i2:67-576(-)
MTNSLQEESNEHFDKKEYKKWKKQLKKEWKEGDVCQCRKKGESIVVELIQINGGKEENPKWEVKEISSGKLLKLFQRRLHPFEEDLSKRTSSIDLNKDESSESEEESKHKKREREMKKEMKMELEKKRWKDERKAFQEKKFKLVKKFRQLSEEEQQQVKDFVDSLAEKN